MKIMRKVTQSDPYAVFQPIDLDVKLVFNIEDKDGKIKPFQMFCNPTAKLK